MRRATAPVSAERWDAMMAVFADALELPAHERPTFVEKACGSDADLLREVESLLAAHDGDAGFLESPAAQPPAPATDATDLGPQLQAALGTAFRVERELQGGGM